VLDLLVLDDPPLLEVDQEELARLQAPEPLDLLGRDGSSPASEPSTTCPSVRLHPAARAQAVAVERRADDAAVGEGDRRGPVPRLHQAGVEGVEAPRSGESSPSRFR
jgi:hypothetical protein